MILINQYIKTCTLNCYIYIRVTCMYASPLRSGFNYFLIILCVLVKFSPATFII